ncbi:TRAP transporter small permease [Rhodovulum sp. 12E13]|uniref:TRAP transporter small permease n=1 Tax=Rhodovulum sp. 12E13 TaxID=2203891 RepID=UPI000E16FB99|nr:TRAP transporter small permease [Rhodovulum sp. 12E13]RDC73105.1 TRAP transporter small permease [Rhodovulum sp. 12E13]
MQQEEARKGALEAPGPAGRAIAALARGLALAGGAALLALALMTVVSIVGRALSGVGLGPVPGDYELVANGVALAIFWSLPWCQLSRGHVTVDLVSQRLPPRVHAALGLAGDVLVTLASAVILRQLWLAFAERFPHGSEPLRGGLGMGPPPFFPETTFELQIPVWSLHGAALVGAAAMLVTGLYCCARAARWVALGREPAL